MKEKINKGNSVLEWGSYLSSLSVTTVGGFIVGGIPGGIIGLTAAATDEYLMNKKIIDKHYLSTSSFWSTMMVKTTEVICETYPSFRFPIQVASVATGPVISYFTHDFLGFKATLHEGLEPILNIVKLMDENKILTQDNFVKVYSELKTSPNQAFKHIKQDLNKLYRDEFFKQLFLDSGLSSSSALVNSAFLYCLGSYGTSSLTQTIFTHHKNSMFSSQYFLEAIGFSTLYFCSKLFNYYTISKNRLNKVSLVKIIDERIFLLILEENNCTKILASLDNKHSKLIISIVN